MKRKLLKYFIENFAHVLGGFIVGILTAILSQVGQLNNLIDKLSKLNPQTISIILATGLFFICVLVFTIIWNIIKNARRSTNQERLGLSEIFHASDTEDAHQKLIERNELFKSYEGEFLNTKNLNLLLASGFNTIVKKKKELGGDPFASVEAPLRAIIDKINKEKTTITVFLIDPNSIYVPERMKKLGEEPNTNTYIEDHARTLRYLENLIKKGYKIECYRYDMPISFKLIATDNILFQQCYPDEKHVEFAPIQIFKRVIKYPHEGSMNMIFNRMFDIVKHHPKTINLLTTKP